jgi:hypothetical protein
MTNKSMAHEAPRQTTFQNGWPFSADTGPEIKNIYVTTNYSLHILLLCLWKFQYQKKTHRKIYITKKLTPPMKIIWVLYDTCINFMKSVEQYLPIGSLSIHCTFQSSLCHCILGFIYPCNSCPSSTFPSSWQPSEHFHHTSIGHGCNLSIILSLYHKN